MKNKGKKIIFLVGILAVVLIAIHNVPKRLTPADEIALQQIFKSDIVDANQLDFKGQIAFIDELVKTLHQDFVVGIPIAYNEDREPSELIKNNGGLCYDFSRTIEKQLMLNGFKIRHVSAYVRRGNFWTTLATTGVYSHSLTEVQTKKGWMIIDSNIPFYAQDENGRPYSFEDLADLNELPKWKLPLHEELVHFYTGDLVFVYGLYSRHGRFYPPYNFIPDYNFRELFYNL